MPSPFPGMNPYLEQDRIWNDFHETFLPAFREVLVAKVRPKYFVRIEEHVFLHERSAEERLLVGRGDVTLSEGRGRLRETATAAMTAPAYGRVPAVDVEQLSYLEIRDRDGLELITVIELLSPSNKRNGPDREQYLSKRRSLLASPVHLVEVDLLRGGPRLPLEELPDCDYYVMVSRAEERPRVGLWPLSVRDPLPEIPIPLKAPDADARVDLKPILDRVYDAAGYEDYLYDGRPQPLLHPQDAQWAQDFVPARAD
jgi:Protein of unknown function (DUF4058)